MRAMLLFLLGGFLFFAGMKLLVWSLRQFSADRIAKPLSRAAGSSWQAILSGTVITCLVQSSSLVTSVTVGMVEAGLCPLTNAIYITMGANLGSTLIPQILASSLPPLTFFCFITALLLLLLRRMRGVALLSGLGLLMAGMQSMSLAAAPIAEHPLFRNLLMAMSQKPLLAILFGAVGAAVLQSSSLVMATLLVLARLQAVPPMIAIAAALGSNVGTCVTAMLAAIGTGKAAKTVAIFHLLYNCAGVLLIYPWLEPFARLMAWTATDIARQVANAHTAFNLFSILAAWPFIPLIFRPKKGTLPAVANNIALKQ